MKNIPSDYPGLSLGICILALFPFRCSPSLSLLGTPRSSCRNVYAPLRRTQDSPAEIIVVDNASSDGTPELVRSEFPCVTLIQNPENFGFAEANNIGLTRSRGQYICLVNSDVNVLPDCMPKLVAYMETNPSIGMLGPQMLGSDGKVGRSSMRFPTIWNLFCRAIALDNLFPGQRWVGAQMMADFQHDHTMDVEVLNGWFWMVRREALNNVGLLDERFFIYGEDIDWCRRFRTAGWRIVLYADARSVHYGGASSAAAPVRFYIEMQRANFQYWQKHHSNFSCFLYCGVVLIHQVLRTIGYSAAYLGPRPADGLPRRGPSRLWLRAPHGLQRARAFRGARPAGPTIHHRRSFSPVAGALGLTDDEADAAIASVLPL